MSFRQSPITQPAEATLQALLTGNHQPPATLRVAIDSGPLKSGDSVRGIGVHTKLLVEHLQKIKDLKVDLFDFSTNHQSLTTNHYDLVHYQKFHPYFLSFPLIKKAKSILTIHDLIYLIYPKHYPSGIRGKLVYWLQKVLVKKMDAIITISETSKKDIVRFLGIPAEKIFPIHLAPGEMFRPITNHLSLITIQKKYGLPNSFVLYLGDVNYNKNLLTLCKACKIAKTPLVIVGKQATDPNFDPSHPETQPLVKLLRQYGEDKNIIRLGFLPDEDLVAVINLAGVYCQPSFYEGFGLPILQAFACGTPVVASKIQAHVEVAGDACLYADPKNPRDFAKKISEVINDDGLRKELIEKGKEKVKEYSWDKTARETFRVYKKVAND